MEDVQLTTELEKTLKTKLVATNVCVLTILK